MGLFRFLLLLLLLVPVLEIYLLIKVGGVIGALPTVFLVVFTAVLGALLVRAQGFATLGRVREALARGEVPALQMLEGMVLLVSGVLLLTPGFFTDTLGFLCLVPAIRQRLIMGFLKRAGVVTGQKPAPAKDEGPRTLEGEYWRNDERR
ncbi:MAG: biotin--acetyl-CoA-carboxylase ligase [Gammaproteobacteria bacterium]|nr:MAG: biotin--acetyl-CoA-carboxylase ligase [Gammaproteobacteria bacterium]TND05831.1 MAG: biotin--acetyl-CoA-carboxylase ligase [Gammaproteobacteria bacterium]